MELIRLQPVGDLLQFVQQDGRFDIVESRQVDAWVEMHRGIVSQEPIVEMPNVCVKGGLSWMFEWWWRRDLRVNR